MNEVIKWQEMTPEQAKVQADLLLSQMQDQFPKIIEHLNRDAIRFNNKEMPKEAYTLELQCMERATFEVMKIAALYQDILESFKSSIANKDEIEQFTKDAALNLMRLLGTVQRHYKLLESI